jgi:hypothetical protein
MLGGGVGSRAFLFGARLDPPPKPLSDGGGPPLAALPWTRGGVRCCCVLFIVLYPCRARARAQNTFFFLPLFWSVGPLARHGYLQFFMVVRARRRAGDEGVEPPARAEPKAEQGRGLGRFSPGRAPQPSLPAL